MHKIVTIAPYLFNDFTASLLVHLNLGANGYKVFQGRMPRTIDGCSVFTVIAFSTKGEVVGRGKMPLPATITSSDQETEILAVIVFVVGQVIEHHATVHFLNVMGILRQVTRQRK